MACAWCVHGVSLCRISLQQLVNFRAFEAEFGEDGRTHPTKKRLAIGHGCNDCCFEIGDATFCRMCGAYPAQRATAP